MKPMRRLYPALALAFLMTMAGAQALLAGAVTVAEVVSLLKAGVGEKVILAQVRASGAGPAIGAREILQLKQAGASDDLLEAMVGSVSSGLSPMGGIRVYRTAGPNGEEILNVTNLDEAGRRIGGELPPQPPTPAARRYNGSVPDADRDETAGRNTPIVVNVYPPASGRADGAEGGYDDGMIGSLVRRGGVYPGYLGLPVNGFCSRCPGSGRHGNDGHRPAQVDDGGLFSRPSAIDTRPFRAHTAAERNRTRFGN